ncbi:hypothetical protein [Cryptosporangium sp. NPDC051539]|uniref:hypothetical protein n=1 Tax=Cryptosporangium sp. NPDC051539 TaxID=3363962 RepID=UPI00379562CB
MFDPRQLDRLCSCAVADAPDGENLRAADFIEAADAVANRQNAALLVRAGREAHR